MVPDPHFFYLEPSRVPAGVAVAVVTREIFEDAASVATGFALRFIAGAAHDHHGQDMVPSCDPADYSTRTVDNRTHLYLRQGHPWWDGPVARRVSKRHGMDHDQWKVAHRCAEQMGTVVTQVRVPEPLDVSSYA